MKGTIEGEAFEFDVDSVRIDEAEAIERALGCSFKAWTERIADGNMSALRGMIWLIRRRDQPGLRFDDPTLGQIRLTAIEIETEDEETDPTEAQTE